ncbi:MAG: arylsulfatase [Acidobacteria bacterium]|nr:arylsulfatase [Acidobacteriota bacterium]
MRSAILGAAAGSFRRAATAAKPANIVMILADDLGYGDLGCYGQKVILTPRLDRMAAEGMRFKQFYAGSTVCAPSRCVLMTGQHLGHCHVRGNAVSDMLVQSLRDTEITVAKALKSAVYATALVGKWGLGEFDQPGHPLRQGFDTFYGYLNQVHAHNYWPDFLYRDRDKIKLPNVVQLGPRAYGGFHSGWATVRKVYSPDLFIHEALSWLDAHKSGPFFLYLPFTLPHANNEATVGVGNGAEIPDQGIYAKEAWPEPDKGQAAMITRLDHDVGRLLDKLRALGIAENTLVLFASDNGPHMESGNDPLRFNPAGPVRGMKRDLYEGGIRVPFMAWWPGTIRPGQVSDHVGYFGDLMATACALAGVESPPNTDSLSFLPTLTGKGTQAEHEYLYWEFYEGGSAQAVRMGKWKGIRKPMFSAPVELYDLSLDPGEKYNVARGHHDVVRKIEAVMARAHVPHPNWKVPQAAVGNRF